MVNSFFAMSICLDHIERSYRAASNLLVFPVVALVIFGVSVSQHCHHIRKHRARAVVLISVKENPQTLEFVDGAEYRPLRRSLFREPEGKAIPVEVGVTGDAKLDLNLILVSNVYPSVAMSAKSPTCLPIRRRQRNS